MLKSVRWTLVWLMFLAGMINYMDRSALSVAAPIFARDLNLNASQMGIIFSSFFIGYAIFNFIGGQAADKYGPKRVFALSMAVWSIFCGLTAGVSGVASAVAVRILFGVGEGPLAVTGAKVVNNWFPRRERATAVGLLTAGTPLGGAISGPIVGYLAIAYGWRLAFVIIGAFGFAWLALWLYLARDTPLLHPRISEAERTLILEGQEDLAADLMSDKPAVSRPLGFYLRQPLVLATALAFFGYNYILFFFLTWFPSYLANQQHMSLRDMSIASVIPWVCGFFGTAGGGFLSDGVYRATGRALYSRKVIIVTCLFIAAACVAGAGKVRTVEGSIGLVSVSIFFLYLTASLYWAVIQDVVPGARVGGVSGFVHFVANLAGIIAPMITGFIIQFTGSYDSAFVLAGVVAVGGALGVLIFVHAPRSKDSSNPASARS